MDDRHDKDVTAETPFSQSVGVRAKRRLTSLRDGPTGVWYGLGMTGLVGWSVVVPTIVGALIGLWLDRHYPGGRSWTLALLVGGLVLGCANAWRWIVHEGATARPETNPLDE